MKLLDEFNIPYEINEQLGKGGQGIVWKVDNDAKVVIKTKLSLDAVNNENFILTDEKEYEKYAAQVNKIKALCAINNLNCIAAPISMLKKPQCGFVMRFMQDMEKIDKQMSHNSNSQNDLDDNFNSSKKKNGSIFKKYQVLKNLARIMSELHSHGLVYCDLSPSNIYISKEPTSHEVWLIDVDNLHYSGNGKKVIGTPFYRAPEIFNQSVVTNTFQSDMYSFALVAYQYLTGAKPFEPEDNADSDSNDFADDWCDDIDSVIESGEVDYVYEHQSKGTFGLPSKYVFTPQVYQLFLRTFNYSGRHNPNMRPTAYEWYEALSDSLEIICSCSNDHYHIGTRCEWCSATEQTNDNIYFSLKVKSPLQQIYSTTNWDEVIPEISASPYYEKSKIISYRAGKAERIDLAPELFSNSQISAVVTIKKDTLTIDFVSLEDGLRLKPRQISWNYKEKPEGEMFRLLENEKVSREIELSTVRNRK